MQEQRGEKMKTLQRIFALMASVAMIIVLFVSAFEIATYSDYGWYEKEYAKYDVLSELEMEMEDARYVTEEMMAYLRGNRKDLIVDTIVNGEEREFFNDREISHMEDVKNLFVAGLWIRRIAFLILVLAIVALVVTKSDWKRMLPKYFLISIGTMLGLIAGIGALVMQDFGKYFTKFHEIFFDNDLWILDPDTDLLIRMLPQGFFSDMVIRIGIVLLIIFALSIIISVVALLKPRNKNN